LRAFLDALDRRGALRRIPHPVNRDFEIAACLAEADGGAALQFDRVAGHAMPVVGNLLNSLGRFANALRVTPATLQGAIIAAIERPLQHRVVSSAPCQELSIADPVLPDELPIPRFFEHESGPYITASCTVA
jgi:UbiD family decarboxylase